MKKPITFLVLVFLVSFFWSCGFFKEKEPEPDIQHKIHEDFKAYTLFKKGTYWVYRDSVTSETDTMTVEHYGTTFLGYDLDGHEFEFYNQHYYADDTLFAKVQMTPLITENPDKYILYYTSPTGSTFNMMTWSESLNPEDNLPQSRTVFYNEWKGYTDVIESETLDFNPIGGPNKSFKNIFKTTWFARGIGPVKYRLRSGRVLELVDYEVVQ